MKKLMFISIKPEYVGRILDGSKTIELRKCRPSIKFDNYIILYSTSPEKKVVGICQLESIIENVPSIMWKSFSTQLGIDSQSFNDYYLGSDKAIGLKLKNIVKLDEGLTLEEIKSVEPKFSPPQTYKYIELSFVVENFKNYLEEIVDKMHLTMRHRQPAQTTIGTDI